MTSRVQPSPKLVAYSTIGVLFLFAGVLVSRVEAAEIGIAFLAAAVIGLAMAHAPRYEMAVQIEPDTVVEGDPMTVHITLRAETVVPWISVVVSTPGGLERGGRSSMNAIYMDAGDVRKLSVEFVPRRWGIFRVGPVVTRGHDSLGFFTYESRLAETSLLRVFPREEVWCAESSSWVAAIFA